MTGSEFILVVLWVACSFVGIILLSRKGYLNEPTNVDIIKIQGIGTEVEMGGRIRPAEYSHARQDDGISIGYGLAWSRRSLPDLLPRPWACSFLDAVNRRLRRHQ